jgi:hypothetical protein
MIIKNISKIYRTASVIRATTITTGSETPALPPTLELTNPNYHENN